jgi:hypothetical protein
MDDPPGEGAGYIHMLLTTTSRYLLNLYLQGAATATSPIPTTAREEGERSQGRGDNLQDLGKERAGRKDENRVHWGA